MIVSEFPGGAVFSNEGGSHLTRDNGTLHITTQPRGLKLGEDGTWALKKSLRMNVSPDGDVDGEF